MKENYCVISESDELFYFHTLHKALIFFKELTDNNICVGLGSFIKDKECAEILLVYTDGKYSSISCYNKRPRIKSSHFKKYNFITGYSHV